MRTHFTVCACRMGVAWRPLPPGAWCLFWQCVHVRRPTQAAVLIDLVVLNSAPDSRPRMMDGLGYRYEVRALGLAAANMRLVAARCDGKGAGCGCGCCGLRACV